MVESKSVTKENTLTLTGEEKAFLNNIQAREAEVLLNSSFMTRDFSLRGNANLTEAQQDQIYASAPEGVWLNARQGSTILEQYNPDNFDELEKCSVLIKGLPRIYTLNLKNDKVLRETFSKGGKVSVTA
jgi:hypothetical protein